MLDAMTEAAVAGARALAQADTTLLATKDDGTPQAAADLASDTAIAGVLAARMPGVPVISEERSNQLPRGFASGRFLLVDPLDGTREFLAGHPDHAVCIALIEQRRPVAGVILAPLRRRIWVAGEEAVEMALDGNLSPVAATRRVLRVDSGNDAPRCLVTSRSRPDPIVRKLFPDVPESQVRQVGAVLKLVAVATGEACAFPTNNPSSEWDIAAGEALIRAAGGVMMDKTGKPLVYGRKARRFLHEPYVAARSAEIARVAVAQWAAC
jgi:3'(2'), 5'-bisphosphate nucleotidase